MFKFCMANVRAAKSPPTSISCRFELFVTSYGGHSSDQKRYNMKSLEKKKRGGKYGVAGISSKESCKNNSHTEGISMHLFPKDEEVR